MQSTAETEKIQKQINADFPIMALSWTTDTPTVGFKWFVYFIQNYESNYYSWFTAESVKMHDINGSS